jgi:hypothetical protein
MSSGLGFGRKLLYFQIALAMPLPLPIIHIHHYGFKMGTEIGQVTTSSSFPFPNLA